MVNRRSFILKWHITCLKDNRTSYILFLLKPWKKKLHGRERDKWYSLSQLKNVSSLLIFFYIVSSLVGKIFENLRKLEWNNTSRGLNMKAVNSSSFTHLLVFLNNICAHRRNILTIFFCCCWIACVIFFFKLPHT